MLEFEKCYTEDCESEATQIVKVKWGGAESNFDIFHMCNKCSKLKRKECNDWNYVFSSETIFK